MCTCPGSTSRLPVPYKKTYAFQAFIQTCMLKKAAWLSFVEVMKNFLGNKKQIVKILLVRCSQYFMIWDAK